jgi:methyl-accepting chemotaxis protein
MQRKRLVLAQMAGIEQANKAAMQLDEITRQNTAPVEEAAAAGKLAAAAATVVDTWKQF